jgi:hypothetical protein
MFHDCTLYVMVVPDSDGLLYHRLCGAAPSSGQDEMGHGADSPIYADFSGALHYPRSLRGRGSPGSRLLLTIEGRVVSFILPSWTVL